MTVGEVVFWAVVYLAVAALIWRGSRRQSSAARLNWLALWSFAGVVGSTAMIFACVATHYENAPGMPRYCDSTPAADIAFFSYLTLTIGLTAAAILRRFGIQSSTVEQRR